MKILANGKSATTWTKVFVCKECRAKLEVNGSDLFVVNDAVFYAGESWEPNVVFRCASCESLNRVTDKVPSGLRDKLISAAAASAE